MRRLRAGRSLAGAIPVLALLALLVLCRRAEAETLCLGPEVGQAVGARMHAGAFDGVLPPAWALDDVHVSSERIDLRVVPPAGRAPVMVELGVGAASPPDGTGRSFSFFLHPGAVTLSADERRALLALATRVDAAVPEAAVKEGCRPSVGAAGWIERGGGLPRWAALLTAACELLIIASAVLFVGRRWRAGASPPSRRWTALEKGALFAGAVGALTPWGDPFAKLWLDTLNDQRDVTDCLGQGWCTSLGESASVPGIHHAVGWLHLRALATLAGIGIDGTLWVVHALNAAAIVLVACAVCRVAGRWAGAAAAGVCALGAFLAADHLVLYNCIALPGLGALLLVVGTETVRRPTARRVVLPALVGAVLANIHGVGILAGVPVVAFAVLGPARKPWLSVLAAGTFVAATLAIGPASWVTNADHIRQHLAALVGLHPPAVPMNVPGTAHGAGIYALLFAVSVVGFVVGLRRGSAASLALAAAVIALPVLGIAWAASATSVVTMGWRYVAFAAPSIAVLVGLCVVPAKPRAGAWGRVDRVLPYVAGLAMAAIPSLLLSSGSRLLAMGGGAGGPASPLLVPLTFRDLAALPRAFEDRGWSYAHVYRSLKSPDAAVILKAFEVLAPAYPGGPAGDDPTNAYVLRVAAERLPRSLPPDWVELRRGAADVALLVFARTALRWSAFDACNLDDQTCARSGLGLGVAAKPSCTYCVPGMPSPFERVERRLELHVPLRATPAGRAWAVRMTRAPGLCAGRITGLEAPDVAVSADGAQATWTQAPVAARPGDARLAWDLNSPSCEGFAYSGLPPFFFEGDADTVDRLEALVQ